ncbi:MAG: bacillithiol biosynthesis cysteine-adding enzyme BshC [Gemmatimonadota bacterium]
MNPLVRPSDIGGSRLVRDYLGGVQAAGAFFRGTPFDLECFRSKLAEVNRRFGPAERQQAADALRPTTPRAAARLARFVEEGGAMITTGQQAGFLTGPLFAVHKALSTVVLARHLEEKLGALILPVFWVATDDHDWAEVNHAHLVDRNGRLRRFELPTVDDDRPLPMSERRLEGDLDSLCDEISQAVGDSGYSGGNIAHILDPYRRSGTTMGEAFRAAIHGLFGEYDLLVTDAADPVVKRGSREVLRVALTDAAVHEERLRARTAEIERQGYQSQVAVLETGTNVFFRTGEGRERLFRSGDEFVVRSNGDALARAELLSLLESEPERFSPNVLLRPVVESAVFPTLAYVGGPSEVAYFAQVSALFDAYGIEPPAVVPRYSGIVVEAAVERVMGELGLEIEDLVYSRDMLVDRVARREIPDPVSEALGGLRDGLAVGFEELIGRAKAVDPTLAGALGTIRNRGLAEVGRAERKIVRAVKRSEHTSLGQLDRVLNALRPNGSPQERVLNVLPYVSRYGEHFLKEIERSIVESWPLPEHKEVGIGCDAAG